MSDKEVEKIQSEMRHAVTDTDIDFSLSVHTTQLTCRILLKRCFKLPTKEIFLMIVGIGAYLSENKQHSKLKVILKLMDNKRRK